MSLIDRYVHAVAGYLPKDTRDDVLQELRTNIEDMLPEDYTDKDVYKVLEELGSPLNLANEYSPKKRYLIGPGYYEKYLSILKMVVGICIAASVSIAVAMWIVDFSPVNYIDKIVELFTNMITGAFVGAVQGAFWVTLIFVILERSGIETGHMPFYDEKWTPDSLPELPENGVLKISRGETVFAMIVTIIFTALVYFQPQLIALYTLGENGLVKVTPVFDLNRLSYYMIFIFASAIFQLGIFVWKYIVERWNMPLVVFHTLYNVLISILIVVMLSDSGLFNPDFIPAIAGLVDGSVETIAAWFNRGMWIFAGVFIGLSAWDSVSTIYKYLVQKYD